MANYKVFYAELVISRGLKLRQLATRLKISLAKQQYTGARNAKHHYALPHVLKFNHTTADFRRMSLLRRLLNQ